MSTDNKQSLSAITLAAIGVVYGDIGTSPLYTLRECLSGQFGFGVERDAVFGFLSLIFWLLIFVVSIKYLTFVMRADNAGEGGILTLMSLAGRNTSARTTSMLVIMGLIGGSFFYGEVVITPAISVMSAIEGLEIIAPQLDTWIVPLSIIVLTLLFLIQKHGTGMVGKLFAPIMLLWFLTLAVLGVRSIIGNPEVLQALNPRCISSSNSKRCLLLRWVRWCCRLPVLKRCMRIWATSVSCRFAWHGSLWCCLHWY